MDHKAKKLAGNAPCQVINEESKSSDNPRRGRKRERPKQRSPAPEPLDRVRGGGLKRGADCEEVSDERKCGTRKLDRTRSNAKEAGNAWMLLNSGCWKMVLE